MPSCLPTPTQPPIPPKCADLETVNLPDGSIRPEFLDSQICILVDNNPSQGDFYSAASGPSSSSQFDSDVANNAPFNFEQATPVPTASRADSPNYLVGDEVQAAFLVDGSIISLGQRGMTLPQPGPDGLCSSSNFVQWLVDLPRQRCRVSDAALAHTCTALDTYSADFFINNLLLARTYVVSSSSAGTDGYVIVGSAVPTPYLASADGTPTTDTAAASTCRNIVSQVSYVLQNTGTSLVAVTLSYALQNVPLTATTFTQTFSASFQASVPTTTPRVRSGRSGYIDSRPILAGYKVTQSGTEYISQFQDGLTVLGPGTASESYAIGDCSGPNAYSVVTASYNLLTACTRSYTLAELESLCVASNSALGSNAFSWLFDNTDPSANAMYVGVWGDSDYQQINDWLPVAVDSSAFTLNTASWNAATRTCSGYVNLLRLQLVTTVCGPSWNPQLKIVAARMSFATCDWTFSSLTNATAQRFELTASVTFARLPLSGPSAKVPGIPPLVPALPDNIFYPFLLPNPSSAPPLSPSPAGAALLAALFCACLVLC